jgi:hypothetical protein
MSRILWKSSSGRGQFYKSYWWSFFWCFDKSWKNLWMHSSNAKLYFNACQPHESLSCVFKIGRAGKKRWKKGPAIEFYGISSEPNSQTFYCLYDDIQGFVSNPPSLT